MSPLRAATLSTLLTILLIYLIFVYSAWRM